MKKNECNNVLIIHLDIIIHHDLWYIKSYDCERYANCNPLAHALIFGFLILWKQSPRSTLYPRRICSFIKGKFLPVCLPLLPWVTSTLSLYQTPILQKTSKIIRSISLNEPGLGYYMCEEDGAEPEILSLAGSVFPPMRSAFFPQETWSSYHQAQNWDR